MKNPLILSTLSAIIAGCAAGVFNIGPDTYVASATRQGFSGRTTAAMSAALSDAQAFCSKTGKKVLVQRFDNQSTMAGPFTSSVTFKCLDPSDPELQRPRDHSDPNSIIENTEAKPGAGR